MTERRAITGLGLSWMQVAMGLVLWILTIGIVYAGIRDTTDENSRRIQKLEENSISRREFDDLKTRLDRIENKLDAALRKK